MQFSHRQKRAVPLYQEAVAHLRDQMISGQLRPGDCVPSETALANELGVSLGTIRKAVDILVNEGLLIKRQGIGTFVLGISERRELYTLFSLEDAAGSRKVPRATVLSLSSGQASASERKSLEIGPRAKVVRLQRLRTINDTPVILEDVRIPHDLFPGIEKKVSNADHLFHLYEDEYMVTVSSVNERIRAVLATDDEANTLKLDLPYPLLEIDRISLTLNNRPAEWRVSKCVTEFLHYATTRP